MHIQNKNRLIVEVLKVFIFLLPLFYLSLILASRIRYGVFFNLFLYVVVYLFHKRITTYGLFIMILLFLGMLIVDILYISYSLQFPKKNYYSDGTVDYKPLQKLRQTDYGNLIDDCTIRFSKLRIIDYQIDELGYRNPPGSFEKSLMIVIGDSYTLGLINSDSSWPAVLEKIIHKGVYNGGIANYGPLQTIKTLEKLLKMNIQNPDKKKCVIWMIYSGNDLIDNSLVESQEFHQRLNRFFDHWYLYFNERRPFSIWRQLFRKIDLLPANIKKNIRVLTIFSNDTVLVLEDEIAQAHLTETEVLHHLHYTDLQESVLRFKELTDFYDIQPLLVLAPSKADVYYELLNLPEYSGFRCIMNALAQKYGVPILDLTQIFRIRAKSEDLYYRGDTHWNGIGNKLAAMEIAEFLYEE